MADTLHGSVLFISEATLGALIFAHTSTCAVRCPMTAEDVRGRRGSARSMASGSALGAARSPAPAARPRAISFFEFVHNGDCASSLVATLSTGGAGKI